MTRRVAARLDTELENWVVESVTSTDGAPEATFVRPDLRHYGLQVSAYERVAGMLLALLVLVGAAVLTLLIMWLTSRIFATQAAVPVVLEKIGEGGGQLGDSMEMESPSLDETDLQQPELTDTLSAVTDAIAAQAALLDNPAMMADMKQKGGGSRTGRLAGSGGGSPGRPRHWEVRFLQNNTVETYARQLDFFGIELGVLVPGGNVEYVYHLTKAKPEHRTDPADREKRYYLTWRRGELQAADRELLRRAGLPEKTVRERLILKFLPPELEAQLVGLERVKAGEDVDRIAATYFGIVADGRGYRFYVIDQSYRYGG